MSLSPVTSWSFYLVNIVCLLHVKLFSACGDYTLSIGSVPKEVLLFSVGWLYTNNASGSESEWSELHAELAILKLQMAALYYIVEAAVRSEAATAWDVFTLPCASSPSGWALRSCWDFFTLPCASSPSGWALRSCCQCGASSPHLAPFCLAAAATALRWTKILFSEDVWWSLCLNPGCRK